MKILLDPAARKEILHAAEFYEDCRQGLGGEFVSAVGAAFNLIRRQPTAWRVLSGRFRRCLLHRFPYGVIYAVNGRTIFVAAVMHLKRKPGYWLSRVKR